MAYFLADKLLPPARIPAKRPYELLPFDPSGAGCRPSPSCAASTGRSSPTALRRSLVTRVSTLRAVGWRVVLRVLRWLGGESVRVGAGVFGRCRRFSTFFTSGMAEAWRSSALIMSGVLASPRSQTTPSAAFTSILPFGTLLSRKMTVSTLRARPTSSMSFGACEACGLGVALRGCERFCDRERFCGWRRCGVCSACGSSCGGVSRPLSTNSSPIWTIVRSGMSEYLTAVRIGSITIRYPRSRLRNAIAQEQMSSGFVNRHEVQSQGSRQRLPLHDRETLACPGYGRGDRQEQLVDKALREERAVQVRTALTQQRPHPFRPQTCQARGGIGDQPDRIGRFGQQRQVGGQLAAAGDDDRERVRSHPLPLALCLQIRRFGDAPVAFDPHGAGSHEDAVRLGPQLVEELAVDLRAHRRGAPFECGLTVGRADHVDRDVRPVGRCAFGEAEAGRNLVDRSSRLVREEPPQFHGGQRRDLYGLIATMRSIGTSARLAMAGSTVTRWSTRMSRRQSRSFGSVTIFMYWQTACSLAAMNFLSGCAFSSG